MYNSNAFDEVQIFLNIIMTNRYRNFLSRKIISQRLNLCDPDFQIIINMY